MESRCSSRSARHEVGISLGSVVDSSQRARIALRSRSRSSSSRSFAGAVSSSGSISTRQTEEPHEEPPVGKPLVATDLSEPADRADFGRSGERAGVLLRHGAHHDLTRTVEEVLDHLPVTRLEDVQRHHAAGEQEDVRERKERDDPRLALFRSHFLRRAHDLEFVLVCAARSQPGSVPGVRFGSSPERSVFIARTSPGKPRISALRERLPT